MDLYYNGMDFPEVVHFKGYCYEIRGRFNK